MRISARSVLMAGVATSRRAPSSFAQSVQPASAAHAAPPAAPTVRLAAIVQPTALPPLPPLLTVLLQLTAGAARARSTTGNWAAPCADSASDTDRAEPRQHDRQHLHLSRAVGAVRVRGRHSGGAMDPLCRLVRRFDHGRLLLRRKLGRQRCLQHHRLASRQWRLRREPGRFRRRRRPRIRLAGTRRAEFIHTAAAVLLLPAAPAGTRSVLGFDDARRPDGDGRNDHAVV